jgi:hypothetical protein
MGLRERLRDKIGGQEEYYTTWFELSLNATPDEPIFYETVIGEKLHQCLTFGVMGKLLVKQKVFQRFDKWVSGLGLQKFTCFPGDGVDEISRKVVGRHLATFFVDNFKVESVHGLLQSVQRFGVDFA